jgi:phage-related protein
MLPLKPIEFLGSSRRALSAFPDDARRMAGFQLDRIQRGLEPFDWKVMPAVGAGVMELRVRDGRENFASSMWPKFLMQSMCFMPSRRKPERRHGSISNWFGPDTVN